VDGYPGLWRLCVPRRFVKNVTSRNSEQAEGVPVLKVSFVPRWKSGDATRILLPGRLAQSFAHPANAEVSSRSVQLSWFGGPRKPGSVLC
jgi:hypothetical protein